jgi:hypothetical protein
VIAVKAATTAVLALAGAALLPATAGAAERTYSVVEARGSQVLTFQADPDTCATYGVCGESGTVRYSFSGEPSGGLVLRRSGRRQSGTGRFRTRGRTTADMTGPTGSCSDGVEHTRDWFSLRGGLARLVFRFHRPRRKDRDYLRTDCPTPTEANLARDDALPKGSFDADDFEQDRTAFRLEGKSVLTDRGYRGTLRWQLRYSVKQSG